jgi:hypothetical protein
MVEGHLAEAHGAKERHRVERCVGDQPPERALAGNVLESLRERAADAAPFAIRLDVDGFDDALFGMELPEPDDARLRIVGDRHQHRPRLHRGNAGRNRHAVGPGVDLVFGIVRRCQDADGARVQRDDRLRVGAVSGAQRDPFGQCRKVGRR